jgi:hypothetical protein
MEAINSTALDGRFRAAESSIRKERTFSRMEIDPTD